jgi:1,2-diacylglycerol 3-beta-galactosyltransferase
MSKKKRILFLLSDTGGGHRSATQAISEALAELYPDEFEISMEDITQRYGYWPFTQIPQVYGWCINSALPLWKLFWWSTSHTIVYKSILYLLFPLIGPAVWRHFATFDPDIVISLHAAANHAGLRILRAVKPMCPFITVVTDMTTVHPAWIAPGVTHCFVSTDIARDQALTYGISPHKVTVYGQPISPRFIIPSVDKQTMRRTLDLDPTCPVVLLTGGGEGDRRLTEIARRLAHRAPQVQLLIVTGRNRRLKRRLEALTWSAPPHIYGFVDHMPELMRAADLLITRAGPGTLSEALVMGLPLIIYGYVPGHEEGNMAYIQAHRAGVYLEQPDNIAQTVLDWTTSQQHKLAELAQNAAKLAYPRAAYKIAEYVHQLLCDPGTGRLDYDRTVD